MEEKIIELYKTMKKIDNMFLHYQKRRDFKYVEAYLPQMREFVLWFMEQNHLGVGEEDFELYKQNLLDILKDILTSMEEKDYVLLHDAIAYGLCDYLETFVDPAEYLGENGYDNI